jgi:hypothetical protein
VLGATTCLIEMPGTVAWAAAIEFCQKLGVRSGVSNVM